MKVGCSYSESDASLSEEEATEVLLSRSETFWKKERVGTRRLFGKSLRLRRAGLELPILLSFSRSGVSLAVEILLVSN